jgi:lipopolysaccharide export system protein LptC
MNRPQLLARWMDRLTLSLPLIVMGFLALGSWWLVRSMPELLATPTDKPVRKDPDYQLERFTLKSFDATGRMTREIGGKEARHYPDVDELHIDQIRVFAQSVTGAQLNAQAQRGVATGDGTRVTLSGQAQAVRAADAQSPRIELQGEKLVALVKEDRLLSSDPVKITRGQDVFTAQTLDFNSRNGEYQLAGRVHGTLAPKTPENRLP